MTDILSLTVTSELVANRHSSYRLIHVLVVLVVMLVVSLEYNHRGWSMKKNVKQVSFKTRPADCYGRCGSDRICKTVPESRHELRRARKLGHQW